MTFNAFLRPTTTLGSGELTRDIDPPNYDHLDQWKVSRLTVMSPSSVLQRRYIVARLSRGAESSEFVDLRLEHLQDNLPWLFDAVATALNALPTTECQDTTSIGNGCSSPTPPATPSEYPLTITFSLVPNSQVTVNVDVEEEILYQPSTTADRGSLTLLTLAHCITSIPSAGCQGDFAQDFIAALRRHYFPDWYNFVDHNDLSENKRETDTEECNEDDFLGYHIHQRVRYCSFNNISKLLTKFLYQRHLDLGLTIQHPEPIRWVDSSEGEELSNINEEFQRLSEVRLQLATDLRLSLRDAENAAMEVEAFNTRQREQLGDGAQVFIDFQDDLKTKQDVVDMIRRLEQSSYIRGVRRS
jgi:hypothetical protein